MTPDNITELIYRYLTGKATDKEISIIADYLHDFPEERDSFAETALIYSCMKTLGSRDIGTMQDRMLARLNARIDAGDDVTATGHEPGMDAAGAEGQTAGAVHQDRKLPMNPDTGRGTVTGRMYSCGQSPLRQPLRRSSPPYSRSRCLRKTKRIYCIPIPAHPADRSYCRTVLPYCCSPEPD